MAPGRELALHANVGTYSGVTLVRKELLLPDLEVAR